MITLADSIQQLIVCGVTLVLIGLLFIDKFKPAILFFAAVLLFLLSGIISITDLLNALANESILSIFLLIFITAGIQQHFNLLGWLDKFFGKAKTGKGFMLRMTTGVTAFSSFLNNTPIVALFMPYVYQWAQKHKVSPAKLLIPLSYAAIVGGMMTVIGTSTNLVLNGLIEAKAATPPGFLDYLIPGVLVSIGGIAFLYFIGYKLLPNRTELLTSVKGKPREYMAEVRIVPNSSIIGKSIIDADLRNLDGVYLFEIIRKGERISPVQPEEIIQEKDALVFAGDTQNIIELIDREKDLKMPYSPQGEGSLKRLDLVETVIPINSNLVGHSLKELSFREQYDAAVVALHRHGERLTGKIGEVLLQAGDLLLITPGKNFHQQIEQENSLYMVSVVQQVSEAKPLAKKGFLGVLLVLLAGLIFTKMGLFFALLILTAYMVATKLLSVQEIKRQLDVNLLVILVSSLAFSTALINSGAAQLLADGFMSIFSAMGNLGIIIGIYVITLILTSFVTHVAAVSIIFPIGYAIGMATPGLNMVALYIAIAFAASASFHSPFSYQTNMMVFGPGGYKFKDFIKVGTPFTLIYSAIALLCIIFYYQLI